MINTLAVIQARMSSQRCPGKVMADIDGQPLIAHLVNRLVLAQQMDKCIIATTLRSDDDIICQWAQKHQIDVVRGDEYNLLARFIQAVDQYPAKIIVRITADNPYTAPALFDQTIIALKQQHYDYVHMPDAPYGSAVDAFTHEALKRCATEASTDYQKEHINAYVLDHPELFKIGTLAPIIARSDIRLTVDTHEDLSFARTLAQRLKSTQDASLAEIVAVAKTIKRQSKIIFRCDGGWVWGLSLGHVFRCLAIADALSLHYHVNIKFAMKAIPEGIQLVQDQGYEVVIMDSEMTSETESEYLSNLDAQLILFDHPDVSRVNMPMLSGKGMKTVVIDEAGHKQLDVDVIINATLDDHCYQYTHLPHTQCYLGNQYVVLSQLFTEHVQQTKAHRVPKNVLVTLGGSDPACLTQHIIKALLKQNEDVQYHIIIGPANRDLNQIKQIVKNRTNFCIHYKPDSLLDLMCQCDFAICAGGRTIYELAVTGAPMLLVPSQDIEARTAVFLAQKQAVLNCELITSDHWEQRFFKHLSNMMNDRHLRQMLTLSANQIFDKNGCQRISSIIMDLINDCHDFNR